MPVSRNYAAIDIERRNMYRGNRNVQASPPKHSAETPPGLQLLTVQAVAKMLGLHQRTIWRMAAEAEAGLSSFPQPLRLRPKTVRFRASDIEAYIDSLAGGRANHEA